MRLFSLLKLLKKIYLLITVSFLIHTKTIAEEIGRGDIKLSSETISVFNRYLNNKKGAPFVFYVTKDGQNSYWSYCPSWSGTECGGGKFASKCEEIHGRQCFIFAEGRRVVWKKDNISPVKKRVFKSKMSFVEVENKLIDLGYAGNKSEKSFEVSKKTIPKIKGGWLNSDNEIIKDIKDLPESEFYFYAFKKKEYFVGFVNQDKNSKLIRNKGREFRKGNKGLAYKNNGTNCSVYSIVDQPKSNNRTYTGNVTLQCNDKSKYVGNWVQYESKGSGKAIDHATGESIDFYFTMSKNLALTDFNKLKQTNTKVAKNKSDKKGPNIIVDSEIQSNSENYTIRGSVQDESGKVYLKLEDQFIKLMSDEFEIKRFSPVNEQLTLIATDKWGNQTKKKIFIKINLPKNSYSEKIEPLMPNTIRQKSDDNIVAIIIGIENYKNSPKAKFANSDAKYFYEYARKAFGIKRSNIKLLIDEDANLINTLSVLSKWLPPRVKSGKTEILVFYSGHGLASPDGETLYFLPYDTDVDILSRSSISRADFLKDLIKLNPSKVTMFLDTCYSGISRDEKTLMASARPIRLKPTQEYITPNKFNIFSASDLNQISSGLDSVGHGIFSYYLMKGLEGNANQDGDNKITNEELYEYLNENVPKVASSMGRKQIPTFTGDIGKALVFLKNN